MENLISQGANVILIFAQDGETIKPALAKATAEGISVIAYDRQIEDPSLLYITFDNVGVGMLMGKTMVAKGRKDGNFAFIKGDPGDPNATFFYNGMMETLKPLIDAGSIKNVCETFTSRRSTASPAERSSSPSGRTAASSARLPEKRPSLLPKARR